MDIVTHALMGVTLGSPFLDTSPLGSAAFMLGSVAPDLDALSRIFGKRAFLRSHQTWSHALPVIAGLGALAAVLGGPEIGLGLALGMTLHSLLDVSNTYGIALFLPFSKRRFCLEWVFFIDAVVILVTLPSLALILQRQAVGAPTRGLALGYGAAMLTWWTLRALLRLRAGRLAPAGTVSLMPSALWPWRYLGTALQTPNPGSNQGLEKSSNQGLENGSNQGLENGSVALFTLNGLTGAVTDRSEVTPRDEAWQDILATLPELGIMRELSPAFHITEVTSVESGTRLRLRDLRVRNFSTRWGEVEVLVTPDRTVAEVEHHV